jgi:hypothetical protein
MRTVLLASACFFVLGVSAYLSAKPQGEGVHVKLRLADAQSGKAVGGIVRVFRSDSDKPLALPGLFDRLRGLERSDTVAGWSVVPAEGATTTLPRGRLRLEAVAGLETALERQDLDLGGATADVTARLRFLFRPEQTGLVAGNTHLHLRGMPLADADEYLRRIPAADGLKVLFLSYLERKPDDQHYITNRYPVGDLKQFDAAGVLVHNGEEHRHNFGGYGQGYGHVMLLNLQQLVRPVSIGPGIMGAGSDEPSLSVGIDEARRQGGTVIWCHNTTGYEDVPNAIAGRLDALNVFDGSRTGTYEDTYYRYLNTGLRLPLSTGTDWFLYDFSRVYAQVTGALTARSWLEAVKAGRSVATNGPLLTLTVDGRPIGATLTLDRPQAVRVEATGVGRHDFRRLELIHNGRVVEAEASRGEGPGYAARLVREVRIDRPGWLAVRIDAVARNELGQPLYAHSSPVYVDVGGKRVFEVEAARDLLRQVEEGRAEVRARGRFSTPQEAAKVIALYDRAAQELVARINQRGP